MISKERSFVKTARLIHAIKNLSALAWTICTLGCLLHKLLLVTKIHLNLIIVF